VDVITWYFYVYDLITRVAIRSLCKVRYQSGCTGVGLYSTYYLFFGGVYNLSLGIIREYLAKIYTEVKQGPIFTVPAVFQIQ